MVVPLGEVGLIGSLPKEWVMSASQYRGQLERKRKQRIEAEKRAGEYRSKETAKRTAAAKARTAADKSKLSSIAASKIREAERAEREAATAGTEAARWQETGESLRPGGGCSPKQGHNGRAVRVGCSAAATRA